MNDKLIEKIKKLFALGSNNDNEHESSSAIKMARKLLDQNNLGMSDLASSEEKVLVTFLSEVNMPYTRMVFNYVSKLYDCQFVVSKPHFLLIGKENNRVTARIVIEFVLETIRRKGKGQGNGFRNSAAQGVAQQVDEIINERMRSQEEVIPGTGLIPMDISRQAKEDINDWLKDNMPNLCTVKSNSGRQDGRGLSVGRNINLGAHINGQKQRAIA